MMSTLGDQQLVQKGVIFSGWPDLLIFIQIVQCWVLYIHNMLLSSGQKGVQGGEKKKKQRELYCTQSMCSRWNRTRTFSSVQGEQ